MKRYKMYMATIEIDDYDYIVIYGSTSSANSWLNRCDAVIEVNEHGIYVRPRDIKDIRLIADVYETGMYEKK